MAYSKAHHFDAHSFKQSFWSKALSHPARIIILSHLLQHGSTAFYILAKKIPLAGPTVSQHLRALRQSGLIESFEKYPHTYYQIKHNVCKELAMEIKLFNYAFLKGTEEEATPHSAQIMGKNG